MSRGGVEQKDEVFISVLCKFWEEDGVWNGIVEHLPVAAFGNSFEEARQNLANAFESHIESLRESGKLQELIEDVQGRSRDYLSADEIPVGSPILRMLVAMKNQEIVGLRM